MQNYADVLESYLIPAEEGFGDVLKNICDRIRKVIHALIERFKAIIAKIRGLKNKQSSKEEVVAELEPAAEKFEDNLFAAVDKVYKGQNLISQTYISKLSKANITTLDPDVAEEGNVLLKEGAGELYELRKENRSLYNTCFEFYADKLNPVMTATENLSKMACSILKLLELEMGRAERDDDKETITAIHNHAARLTAIAAMTMSCF